MRRPVPLLLVVALGCEGDPSGSGEPLVVREGVFHEGALPFDDDATTPAVTNAGGVGSVVSQGQGGIAYGGLATPDGYSVAVAMEGVGSGYWVTPLGPPDVTQDDQLLFDLTVDYGRDVPFGLQTLSFVAIDGEGVAGPRYDVPVCILPDVANNNLAACDAATVPQAAVISLTWDVDVDLDLVVVAPNGKVVSAKAPTTLLPGEDGKITTGAVNDPATGSLTRDSNGDCRIDGIRRESLVFVGEPPPGDYLVYVALRSACGHGAVTWGLADYRRVDGPDDTHAVEETDLATGVLLPAQLTPSAALGTYVTTVSFP